MRLSYVQQSPLGRGWLLVPITDDSMTNAPFPPGSGGAPPTTSYSGPSISSVPRRSSYASVVSGAAASPQNYSPFSHLVSSNHGLHASSTPSSSSYPPHYHADGSSTTSSRLPRHSSALDAEMQMNTGGGSGGWRRSGGPLPAYSRQFASYLGYDGFLHGATGSSSSSSSSSSFFVPSYLRNSRYVERLEAAHRAKLAAQRDAAARPSLSASSSHVNLHRMAPSHRGVTYDIIEKEPPGQDDDLMPLPSRWNESDKYVGLDLLNDGLEVRYMGPPNKHDHEAAAVRADHPMPPQCGIYYFEVTILSKSKEGYAWIPILKPQ